MRVNTFPVMMLATLVSACSTTPAPSLAPKQRVVERSLVQERTASRDLSGTTNQAAQPMSTRPAPTQVVAAPRKPGWTIRLADGLVSNYFRRWGSESNPHWQVAWEVPVEYKVEIEDEYVGLTFQEAVRKVTNAYAVSDYPIWPCFYRNYTLRIVRRTRGDNTECLN